MMRVCMGYSAAIVTTEPIRGPPSLGRSRSADLETQTNYHYPLTPETCPCSHASPTAEAYVSGTVLGRGALGRTRGRGASHRATKYVRIVRRSHVLLWVGWNLQLPCPAVDTRRRATTWTPWATDSSFHSVTLVTSMTACLPPSFRVNTCVCSRLGTLPRPRSGKGLGGRGKEAHRGSDAGRRAAPKSLWRLAVGLPDLRSTATHDSLEGRCVRRVGRLMALQEVAVAVMIRLSSRGLDRSSVHSRTVEVLQDSKDMEERWSALCGRKSVAAADAGKDWMVFWK